MAEVTLLMAIHCHQPVGNFDFVFEEAYAKAYEPFVRVLERHPAVRLALHYSGPLLEWLIVRRPAFLERLRALIARGQVELLASGYYEPILPLIPEADRQGQIAMMRTALRAQCGIEAAGLWLTERVWEPDLALSLARAKIRYTIVDANQFAAARPWLPQALQVADGSSWEVLGSYLTEYVGASVRLFPASQRLRYLIPFARVDDVVASLKRLRRRERPVAITFADDGEKFGLWPRTYHWVYEAEWLERWCAAIERERSWLTVTTFRDYMERTAPDGRVYLPGGSYTEMLEWSGGAFRNFFLKYPEAHALQQKMLRVSRAVGALRAEVAAERSPHASAGRNGRVAVQSALLARAERALYAGQCNCAYWHGVFGGLYLAHLRRAVWSRLVEAEAWLSQAHGGGSAVTVEDTDQDGQAEVRVGTPTMTLVVDPAEGGTITEWSLSGARLNLLDTLSRQPEPYHRQVTDRPRRITRPTAATALRIRDLLGVKEQARHAAVVYDDYRRTAFVDVALPRMPTLSEVLRATWRRQLVWPPGAFRLVSPSTTDSAGDGPLDVVLIRDVAGGRIRKRLQVAAERPILECVYELDGLLAPVVGLEFNLSLRDERHVLQATHYPARRELTVEEPLSGVTVRLCLDPPAAILLAPVEAVSESEGGVERTYQQVCLLCCWAPAASRAEGDGAVRWTARLRWEVTGRSATIAAAPADGGDLRTWLSEAIGRSVGSPQPAAMRIGW
jgi:alpha-amylase